MLWTSTSQIFRQERDSTITYVRSFIHWSILLSAKPLKQLKIYILHRSSLLFLVIYSWLTLICIYDQSVIILASKPICSQVQAQKSIITIQIKLMIDEYMLKVYKHSEQFIPDWITIIAIRPVIICRH